MSVIQRAQRSLVALLAVSLCGFAAASVGQAQGSNGGPKGQSNGFIENRGQVNEAVLFYATGANASVFLTREAMVWDLMEATTPPTTPQIAPPSDRGGPAADPGAPLPTRACAVWVRFEGANAAPRVEARGELASRYNYFLGGDPARWRTQVPAYAEIVFHDLWPGCDLVFSAQGREVSYRVELAPGADPTRVRFQYDGAEQVVVLDGGDRRIKTALGSVFDVQRAGGSERVLCWGSGEGPRLENPPFGNAGGGERLSATFSTFLGGAGEDKARSVVLDASGNPVLAGYTYSSNFPTTAGVYDRTANGQGDAFVSKFSSTGALLWSTYLGGSADDRASCVKLNSSGQPILVGNTASSDFPTTLGAYDRSYGLNGDAFVAKLSSNGATLLAATFLGGSQSDVANGLDFDASGAPVVAGTTYSTTFQNGWNNEFGPRGAGDGYVFKLNAALSSKVCSYRFGGTGSEVCLAVALNPALGDMVSVTGCTYSSNFPTYCPWYAGSRLSGSSDAYVTMIDTSGHRLLGSSFLGGTSWDTGTCIAANSAYLIVGGQTGSSDFPIWMAYRPYRAGSGGGSDGFVVTWCSGVSQGSYLGGSGSDCVSGVTVDSNRNILMTGWTNSTNFPQRYPTQGRGGDFDAFATELDWNCSALAFSTYLGGAGYEVGEAVAATSTGDPVLVGATGSSNFPFTSGAYDTSFNGGWTDAFVTKLNSHSYLVEGGPVSQPLRANGGGPVAPSLSPAPAGSVGSAASAVGCAPNPFHGSTTLRFALSRSAPVSVGIYDVGGRLVRALRSGSFAAGRHEVSWNGRDDAGRSLPPGVYLYRIESPELNHSGRVVMLKNQAL